MSNLLSRSVASTSSIAMVRSYSHWNEIVCVDKYGCMFASPYNLTIAEYVDVDSGTGIHWSDSIMMGVLLLHSAFDLGLSSLI